MPDPPSFDPAAMLRVLEEHGVAYVLVGGLAATLHGSPHVSTDVDLTPSRDPENLERLASALAALQARVRAPNEPREMPGDLSPSTLAQVEILNLTTLYGELHLTFAPVGTGGYEDLRRNALEIEVHGTTVVVAHLADVIRSKEAAGREKDRLTLPTLRRLLERLD